MFQKLKKFFGFNKTLKDHGLNNIDNENFQNIRINAQGAKVICMSMDMHINAMANEYPEWKGLFKVGIDKDNNVVVICLKGFSDSITRKAIPYTWRRKSFVENCMLFGVEKIIYRDPISNTFDLLEIQHVDISKLP